jgi:hypothetical protein
MPHKISINSFLQEELKRTQEFFREMLRRQGNPDNTERFRLRWEDIRPRFGDDTFRALQSGCVRVSPTLRELLRRPEQPEPGRQVQLKKRQKSAGRKKIEIPHLDEVIGQVLDEHEKNPLAKPSAKVVMKRLKRPPYRVTVLDEQQRTVERRIRAARKARR